MKRFLAFVMALTMVAALFAASASAEEGKSLLIYFPQSRTELGDVVAAMAKEELGIDLEFLKADGGTCRDKILEEKNNPQADLVLGLAQVMIEPLITEDCLIPYTASWTEEMDPIYVGTDGYYSMYWQTPIIIVYNPEFISGDMIPTSWEDLAKPEYKGLFRFGKLVVVISRRRVREISELSEDIDMIWDEER